MPALTLEDVPEEVVGRIRAQAAGEGRPLSQQAIVLLERAVAEQSDSFHAAYRRFRRQHGPSPLTKGDLRGLRSDDHGRKVPL